MTETWPLKPLGTLVENFDSIRVPVKESERKSGPYPYYGASGVVDYVDGHLFDGEYLLIAEDGENLRTQQTPVAFMANGKFWVNNHAHIVRANAENNTRFLMYALRVADVVGHLTGSAMPKLTQGNMNRIPVITPLLSEQCAIAGVLGSLDDKIESNRRTSRTLERLARAIFRAWFVDFEPVKAKAAGARSFPGMPQEAFDALPTRLVPSELGPIPEGWEVGELSGMATISRASINPQDFAEEVFDHLSIPAYDDSKRPVVEPGTAIKSNKFLVIQDCVLVSKLNPRIPRVWLPPRLGERRQIASTEFLVTLPKSGWHYAYLYCLVQQREIIDDMAQRASGTSNSHQRVKTTDYLRTPAVLPRVETRATFTDAVLPLLDASQAMAAENSKLAKVRDCLLPKLLSGEIRVEGDRG